MAYGHHGTVIWTDPLGLSFLPGEPANDFITFAADAHPQAEGVHVFAGCRAPSYCSHGSHLMTRMFGSPAAEGLYRRKSRCSKRTQRPVHCTMELLACLACEIWWEKGHERTIWNAERMPRYHVKATSGDVLQGFLQALWSACWWLLVKRLVPCAARQASWGNCCSQLQTTVIASAPGENCCKL